MDEIEGVAFWSYTHEDDRLDNGNIVALAQKIIDEYSLITATSLQLFVDRGIAWGEEWRSRIEGALAGTTFFIPIVTPRYFSRPECRRELTMFHAKAEGAGLGELLMPILYSSVKDFNEANSDELIALTSRYQYEDWTSLRLEDPAGPTYRKAVHRLANRLVEISEAVYVKQVHREVALVDGDDDDDEGLYELSETLNPLGTEFLEALETHHVTYAQYHALAEVYGPRLRALKARRADPRSESSLIQRWAREEISVTERLKADSLAYDKIRLELEPTVERVFRLLRAHPKEAGLFAPLWVALGDVERAIEKESRLTASGAIYASEYWQEWEHISQLTRQVVRLHRQVEERLSASNEAVARWVADWHELEKLEGWPTSLLQT